MKSIIFFGKNLNIGGMEKSLVILLNSLVKKYKVTLVLEDKKGVLLNDLNNDITVLEYKVSNLKLIVLRKILNYIKRICWVIKYKNKYDFSCNYATYSIIGSKLAQISSKNCTYYIHSDYYKMYEENIEEVKKFFSPHNITNFKKIIFVSNESQCNFLNVFPELKNKSTVINNLIDSNYIISKSEQKNISCFNKNDTNFVFIGRLDNTSKNFDLLLNSFRIAINKNNNIKLCIIGDGEYKEKILKYIKNNKLETNIILLGEQKNPYTYLKQSDCLILTSKYEGFPVVYLESLVLNKYIMTTVPTSDDYIDIRKFATILEFDENKIAQEIIEYKKNKLNYKIDFEQININKIEKIKKIIEV